jgi:hypothetical protein
MGFSIDLNECVVHSVKKYRGLAEQVARCCCVLEITIVTSPTAFLRLLIKGSKPYPKRQYDEHRLSW